MLSAIFTGIFAHRITKKAVREKKGAVTTARPRVRLRRIGIATMGGALAVGATKSTLSAPNERRGMSLPFAFAGLLIGVGYEVCLLGLALAAGLLVGRAVWNFGMIPKREPLRISAASTA